MPHSNHLLPYGVVVMWKGGESSKLIARATSSRMVYYKNMERPTVSIRHGEQVCRVWIDSKMKSIITCPTVRLSKLWGTCPGWPHLGRHWLRGVGAERPSTWGGTSQNLGRNDRVWGGRGADRPGADRLRGGSTGTRRLGSGGASWVV